ncbi:MAG: hypothetical protein L0Y44_09160 [Phycisphaerales bacterium]|nr:hypothetical protein [Phycisphaerales bacterium]MCI0630806.1 hypothetical protein [Phycisphaerales bacterium]MCI0675264.1 hypothetical protein [Phycisphaerales bacterium]
MPRRSLTLLELLIAMVLVVMLGALIFPSLVKSLDERTFESAADETNQQLMMARAHAQLTGSPIEVTYRADSSQVQVRWFGPLRTGGKSRTSEAGVPDDREEETASSTSDASVELIGETWDSRPLGRGIRFSAHPPKGDGAEDQEGQGSAEQKDDPAAMHAFDELLEGQDVRLAVFMPDGSALIGEPVWLNDENGRCGMLTIDPWNGLPAFERVWSDQASDSHDEKCEPTDAASDAAPKRDAPFDRDAKPSEPAPKPKQ